MIGSIETAGVRVALECDVPWLTRVVEEGTDGRLSEAEREPDLAVRIEQDRRAFDVEGWPVLCRGVWHKDGDVVIRAVCGSGFDLRVRSRQEPATFEFRRRPHRTTRAAMIAMPSRFRLLARAALLQYPAMWWAGTMGRVPVHAVACTVGAATPLLAGPSGVGKTTLLSRAIDEGGLGVSDNLAITDGRAVWGVLEPIRSETGTGRRMPHGRRETRMERRVTSLTPDRVVLLRRGDERTAGLRPCEPEEAARALAAGTYMAGELRRYWSLVATLAIGTGLGPAHPHVMETMATLSTRVPCYELTLATTTGVRLASILASEGSPACV